MFYQIIQWIFQPLWFMLPAYIGNITPLFVKKIPWLSGPIDFHLTFNNERVFGDHKTWRGLISGVFVGTIVAIVQGRPFYQGTILALGNFIGDLLGAFMKRQMNIPPGGKNVYIDALPSPIVALLAAYLFGFLSLPSGQCVFIIGMIIPLHIGFNILWHRLKLKSVAW
jgi:CDP-2,3-bis-(O-geranylgeranyl)-sn-glycerol synthase